MFLMNDTSRKSLQVRRTAEEPTTDVNHLQPQQTNGRDKESVFWPQAEGPVAHNLLRQATAEPPVAQKLTEIRSLESRWGSATDQGPSYAPSLEDKQNLEANLGLESKRVEVIVLSEEEKKERKTKKKAKSGGARKPLLR